MNNKKWESALRDEFNKNREGKRSIKLPAGLIFGGTSDCVSIEISKPAMEANMQSDSAAFDGWAFVLKRWLGVGRFHLSTTGEEASGVHYQRFLFRLRQFSSMMGNTVNLDTSLIDALKKAEFEAANPAILNISPRLRQINENPLPENPSETELEIFLCQNHIARDSLMRAFNLRRLCRQFPVGLFKEKVAAGYEIFSGKKSAIDLIGLADDDSVHVFELKKDGNIKVGALSELIFYLGVLDELRSGRWTSKKPNEEDSEAEFLPKHIQGAPNLAGHILAPDRHPLIDDQLLQLISTAMLTAGWKMSIDYRDLKPFLPTKTRYLDS